MGCFGSKPSPSSSSYHPRPILQPYSKKPKPSQDTLTTQWPGLSDFSLQDIPHRRVKNPAPGQDSWHTLHAKPRQRILEIQELNGRWVAEEDLGRPV